MDTHVSIPTYIVKIHHNMNFEIRIGGKQLNEHIGRRLIVHVQSQLLYIL